jgi:hypothetical protein
MEVRECTRHHHEKVTISRLLDFTCIERQVVDRPPDREMNAENSALRRDHVNVMDNSQRW